MFKNIALRVAEKLGFIIEKTLGEGSKGEAFLLNNGQVMKITDDESEYFQSTELTGQKIERLTNIYNTYIIRNSETGRVCYAIIQEKIDTCDKEIFENFDIVTGFYRKINNYIRGAISLQEVDDVVLHIAEKYDSDFQALALEYREIGITQKSTGFLRGDVLACNLGRKNGLLTSFDFGYSNKWKLNCEENVIEI